MIKPTSKFIELLKNALNILEKNGVIKTDVQKKMNDKNILFIGDSIHAYEGYDNYNIPYLIGLDTGCKVYNFCQGGTTMAKVGADNYIPFCGVEMINALVSGDFSTQEQYAEDRNFVAQLEDMKKLDMSTIDCIVVEFGTNDTLKDCTLDNNENLFDVTTTGGALRTMIKTIQTYNPLVSVLVCNVQKMTGWLDAEHSKTYDSAIQNEVIENICKDYCIPLIDIYNKLGLNDYTSSSLLKDGLHRNLNGMYVQAKIIINYLNYYL